MAGRTTRVEVSRRLGLNKSTITNIVDELIKQDLIEEGSEGSASPKGGRRPVKISINRRYGYVLGFELRPDSYTVLAVNLLGDILFSKSEENLDIGGDNLKPFFLDKARSTLDDLNWLEMPLLGIGVGMSGIINSENRIIKGSVPLGIYGSYDFYEEICSAFNVPVFIDNDANCGAWGELVFHRSSSPRNFLYVLLEFWKRNHFANDVIQPAIGMGVVINGTLYYGSNGTAGEFKSVLSSYNKDNIQIEAVSQYKNQIDMEDHPELMEAYITELARNVAMLTNTLNLDRIFFGGDVDKYRQIIPSTMSKAIDNNWGYDTAVNCEILFSSMGKNTVPYGAAGLVLDKLFIDLETLNTLDQERKNDFYLLQKERQKRPMKK